MTSLYTQPALLEPRTKARSVDINNLNNAVKAAFDILPGTGQSWAGVHDYSAGTLRAKAPIAMSDVVTKLYVDNLAFSGALPAGPALGSYEFVSLDGVFNWRRRSTFSSANKLAAAHAIALSF